MTAGPENIEQQSPEQTPSSEAPSPLVAALQREHPDWVREVVVAFDETTIIVPRESIVEVCSFLKTSPETRFDFLADICGADRGVEEEPRFEARTASFYLESRATSADDNRTNPEFRSSAVTVSGGVTA